MLLEQFEDVRSETANVVSGWQTLNLALTDIA